MQLSKFVGISSLSSLLSIGVFSYLAYSLGVLEFGEFQLFINALVTIATLSSLKLEEALYIGDKPERASFLAIYLISLALFSSIFIVLTKYFWESYLFAIDSLILLVLSVYAQGSVLYLGHVYLSEKRFSQYLLFKVSLPISLLIAFLIMNFSFGLQLPAILFSLVIVCMLSLYRYPIDKPSVKNASPISFLSKYRSLLYVNFPMSLFTIVMTFIVPVYVAEQYGVFWAGLYIFADKVIDAPFNMLGNALSKYVYAKSSKQSHIKIYRNGLSFFKLGILFLCLVIPLEIIFFNVVDEFQVWTYLGEWKELEVFFVYLLVFKTVKLANMPMANLLTLIKKQVISFNVMVVFFAARLALLWYEAPSFIEFVLYWSVIGVAYYMVHMICVLWALHQGRNQTNAYI